MTNLLFLAGGLILLVLGGELLVRGAVALARRLGVSPLMIGLTLVGFGTSTPELVTSLQAAFADAPGIVVGSVVGSNVANILLILGLAALISPIRATPAAFRRDGSVLLLSALLCLGVVLFGSFTRPIGVGFLAILCAYLVATYLLERNRRDASAEMHESEGEAVQVAPGHAAIAVGSLLIGIALTILGARFLVDAAVELARGFGVSQSIIGLTVVAIGTSLPELVTSVVAAARRQGDLAFGNVVGSNIFNSLGILGVTALAKPIAVPAEIAVLDIWVMLAATLLLLIVTITGWRVNRGEGAFLVTAYVAYLAFIAVTAGSA